MTDPPAGIPGIDLGRLADWLNGVLPDAGDIVDVSLLAGGRSNLTYRIELGGSPSRVVLRRPPLGHVLPTAHDMGREHRVLTGLSTVTGPGRVPVPRPIARCDDETVLGVRFYVMDYVEGQVLRTVEDGRDVTPRAARLLSERLADSLAAIHRTDLDATGLADFGRPEGYMQRQLARWGRQWEHSRTALREAGVSRELPAYDTLVERLGARLPDATAGRPGGLVHGDFRLDNALVRLDPEPEIKAIVDWEMSTLGDPLADLGLTLTYWVEAGDTERLAIPVGSTITTRPGFLTAAEFAARYAEQSGYDLADLDFYVAFGCFKLAVVAEGIHARYRLNQTVGEGFEVMGDGVPLLLNRALRVLDTGSV